MLTEIREAREELEKLEHKIASSNKPVEIELELSLRHAYHRHIENGKYSNLTEADFKKWGKFPKGFDEHL